MSFTDQEIERYQRHLLLPLVGTEGQARLKDSSVMVIGAGGLGSPVLLYLASSGVGKISIVDGDVVALSNLQRQVIHETPGIGANKAESSLHRLHNLNPEIDLCVVPERITLTNAPAVLCKHDLVVDCTDNLQSRFLINEFCVELGIPLVFGAVFQFEGQVSVFDASRGPCLRCMYPVIPDPDAVPDPAQHGLMATVPGVIGMLQANEALKLILGIGEPLIGTLVLFDALTTTFKHVRILKNEKCPVCAK